MDKQSTLKRGEPCSHHGCLQHLSHPCEGCGRIGGETELERAMAVCGAAGYACVPMVPDREIIRTTMNREWPGDWERGKAIQWEVAAGSDIVPFAAEFECAAGKYQRIIEVASKSTFQALPSISYVTAMEIADALLSDLTDRRGFRQAWDNTDTTVCEEIRQTWRKTMQRIVNASVEK